jgi:prephenate dehydrogenase
MTGFCRIRFQKTIEIWLPCKRQIMRIEYGGIMTVNISIIGLGQIGASIGLALANHKDQVTTLGYDQALEISRIAQKMGAVEKLGRSLSDSVKEADAVILALPFDQVQETLKSIGQDIQEEGLLIDTTPVKTKVAAWVKEYVPAGRHYIGLTPAINPLVLDEASTGIEAARADLFQNGLIAVTAPQGTAAHAFKFVEGLITLLGARAYFADQAEMDGIMASVHTLPGLAAAALAQTVMDQPGWGDIRKLAGRPFVTAMRPLDLDESAALAEAAQQNRVNTIRLLDEYIETLRAMRDEIDGEKKKSLRTRLERILKARTQWRHARADGDWQAVGVPKPEIPSLGDYWKQQIGLGKLVGKGNKKREED